MSIVASKLSNSYLCHVSRDEDLLDDIRPSPTTRVDVLIEVAKIQWAAEELRDLTAFLGDFEAFSEIIPIVGTSVNKFIAGEDRTIADLFDFTGMCMPFIEAYQDFECYRLNRLSFYLYFNKIGPIV